MTDDIADKLRLGHTRLMMHLDDAGHSPECHIRYPPPTGGYCSCGLFPSDSGEAHEKIEKPGTYAYSRNDPKLAYAVGFGIVVGMAIGFVFPMILLILVWIGVL